MKPPEQVKREFVAQWLAKAGDDLRAAEDLLREGRPYRWIICYHAQQAVEKYLKAYLVHGDVEPPRVHDLADLLKAVESANPALAAQLREVRSLSGYAVASRYPGDAPTPTLEETQEAVRLAVEASRAVLDALQDAT